MSSSIFAAINLTKAISEYFGLIEGVSSMLDKLVHQAYRSGKQSLEYALTSSGSTQLEYLKQARIEFNQATTVESNEALVSSYLGLALCQYWLGEHSNSQITLSKIRNVQLTRSEKFKYIAADSILPLFPGGLGGNDLGKLGLRFKKLGIPTELAALMIATGSASAGRQLYFVNFKEKALATK